jgi:glycosyltransferase involved in cell wall biosynthesis
VKILAVNWQDPANPHAGGAEIHLFEILDRLASKGHNITVLCSGWPRAQPLSTVNGVEIHRTGDRYSFPAHARRYFRNHLANRDFDVVLDDINKIPLCTPLWRAGAPVVALVPHLFGTTAFRELSIPLAAVVWLSERLIPYVYRQSLFHVISKSTASDLVERGIASRNITVIYPGIDCERYTPDESRRSPTPLFAYLGRLKRYKGVDIVLRAFAEASIRGARLEVAGTGDLRPELERLARRLGIANNVTFSGYVDEATKQDLLRRAWSLVFASPKEGWGITNLEAQASGTPVIVSDSPGLRESVKPGASGVLVQHGNIKQLAQAMRNMASDPLKVAHMGAEGRRFASTFSWDNTAEQTELHIREAIQQGSGRRSV